MRKEIWNSVGSINSLLFMLYSLFVLLAAVVGHEHFSYYYFVASLPIVVLLSVVACPSVVRFFSRVLIKMDDRKANQISHTLLCGVFYVVPFLVLFVYYIAYYPGGFSPDSILQYTQVVEGHYNDWHPVIQTLIAFKLPLAITGGRVGSIILFQIIWLSLALGYTFNSILKYTNIKYVIGSMVFVILNPQFGNMAMFPWKDMSFAIGALLLSTYSLLIYVSRGVWIKKPLNMVVFIIVSTVTMLSRHNAVLFVLPLVFAILFYVTKIRGIVVCFSILILCVAVKGPIFHAMGVEKPDQRQVETLGFPMTIIGASLTYSPELLDEETREFGYKVAPKEVWQEKYRYGSFNQVKWDERTNLEIIEECGSSKVISMMFRCIKSSKKESILALIKLTQPVYTITDKWYHVKSPYISPNKYGITFRESSGLSGLLSGYCCFMADSFPHVFMYLGIMHMLLIVGILSKCRLNKLNDWKRVFFILPTFSYNYGTLLLLTSSDDAVRFFYYTFLLMPILLVFLFHANNERSSDIHVQYELL